MNVTDFIIRSACEKAEQTLSDQSTFVLNEKRWKLLNEALDRPAVEKPRLRRLFSEPYVVVTYWLQKFAWYISKRIPYRPMSLSRETVTGYLRPHDRFSPQA